MEKKTALILVIVLVCFGILVAAWFVPGIKEPITNGLMSIFNTVASWLASVHAWVMANPYGWVIFWFVMPAIGFLLGSIIFFRLGIMSSVANRIAPKRNLPAVINEMTVEPPEPEAQPSKPVREEAPQTA